MGVLMTSFAPGVCAGMVTLGALLNGPETLTPEVELLAAGPDEPQPARATTEAVIGTSNAAAMRRIGFLNIGVQDHGKPTGLRSVARHAPHVLSHLLLPWPAAGPGLADGQSRTGTSASIRATSG